ncbi:MAG: class I SAM-dependent methyltransferase [Minisyncoccia bacterium]
MSTKDFEDTRWREKPQQEEFRHRAALSLISSGRVLDVGCGDGFLMDRLRDRGIAVQGVDLSPVAVAHCTEQNLKAVICDITNDPLPFRNGAFTTVVALDVLEHVLNPEKIVSEMARVSSEYVVIGVPNFSSLPARLQTLVGNVPENNHAHKGHVYWFNWNVLEKMAADSRLKIDEVRVNAPGGRLSVVGPILRACARMFPNVFALSFVVRFSKKQS